MLHFQLQCLQAKCTRSSCSSPIANARRWFMPFHQPNAKCEDEMNCAAVNFAVLINCCVGPMCSESLINHKDNAIASLRSWSQVWLILLLVLLLPAGDCWLPRNFRRILSQRALFMALPQKQRETFRRQSIIYFINSHLLPSLRPASRLLLDCALFPFLPSVRLGTLHKRERKTHQRHVK